MHCKMQMQQVGYVLYRALVIIVVCYIIMILHGMVMHDNKSIVLLTRL
jgi:hypothetical protein